MNKTAFEKAYAVSKDNAKKNNTQVLKAMEDKLRNCTFSPTINESRSPRSFNEFIKEQDNKQKQKEVSLAELHKEKTKVEEAAVQHSPTINEVTWS